MKSMTGFGKHKSCTSEVECDVEIKSINGKYLDLRIYLPRDYSFYESSIRSMFSGRLSRGTVEIRVNINDHREPSIALNRLKLKRYYDLFIAARTELCLEDEVSLEFLMNEPGIIENQYDPDSDIVVKDLLISAIKEALRELDSSLHAEALVIKRTISDSIRTMRDTLEYVKVEITPYKEYLYETFKTRVAEILKTFDVEILEQRIFQETAIYLDKYDVQEEITRLTSHFDTLEQCLEREEDNGKSLNFILQEIQREANTLGSKFSTANTFKHILVLKEEIEKCREIVQNVA